MLDIVYLHSFAAVRWMRMEVDRYEGRDKIAIGARLELSRQALGMDQRSFAGGAGIKTNTYNQYETGTNRPQIDAALALKDHYRLTLDWIYAGDMSGLSNHLHSAIANLRRLRRGE